MRHESPSDAIGYLVMPKHAAAMIAALMAVVPGCYCNSDLMYEIIGGYYLISEGGNNVEVHRNGYDSSYLIPCTVLDWVKSDGVAVVKQMPNGECDDSFEGETQFWLIDEAGARPLGPFDANEITAYVETNSLPEKLLDIL